MPCTAQENTHSVPGATGPCSGSQLSAVQWQRDCAVSAVLLQQLLGAVRVGSMLAVQAGAELAAHREQHAQGVLCDGHESAAMPRGWQRAWGGVWLSRVD